MTLRMDTLIHDILRGLRLLSQISRLSLDFQFNFLVRDLSFYNVIISGIYNNT